MRRALSRVLISLVLTLCPSFFDVAEADDSAEVRTLKKQVETLQHTVEQLQHAIEGMQKETASRDESSSNKSIPSGNSKRQLCRIGSNPRLIGQ